MMIENFDLSDKNSMALSCVARYAYIFEEESQIEDFFRSSFGDDLPWLILSAGSNLILPSHLNACVLMPRMRGVFVQKQTDQAVEIEVMAGEDWHNLVIYTVVGRGWFGLENLVLIPSLVGAAPVQNIGAYGVQLEDVLTHVRAYHIPSKTWKVLDKTDCAFGYRDSIFKQQANQWIISRVGLKLHKNAQKVKVHYGDVQAYAQAYADIQNRQNPNAVDVMYAIKQIRQQKLPDVKKLPNCGSFFQNPIIKMAQFKQLKQAYPQIVAYPVDADHQKLAAAWLIDQAGMKGKGIDPILTHRDQALVLTNHAPHIATQADILATQQAIQDKVWQKFSVHLHREPIWVNADGSIDS